MPECEGDLILHGGSKDLLVGILSDIADAACQGAGG
jgi:hypothetical protein